MHREASQSFLMGWRPEQVEAEIMTHDSGKQLCIRTFAELAGMFVPKGGWFNRSPMRNPERTNSRSLIENLGYVAALFKDSYAQKVVLQAGRLAAFERNSGHGVFSGNEGC